MRRALITGVYGFSGRHLALELQDAGWEVVGLGQTARSHFAQNYFCGNIADAQFVSSTVQEVAPDAIFPLAGLTPAKKPLDEQYYRINVLGTLNILSAALLIAPKPKIMVVSSSAMYGGGNDPSGLIDENCPLLPVNAYGVSKAAQHLMG